MSALNFWFPSVIYEPKIKYNYRFVLLSSPVFAKSFKNTFRFFFKKK